MEKHIKEKIDKVVDVFIDHLLSGDADAGWRNAGMFQSSDADAIKSTAGDKDLRMINNVSLIKNPHALYPLARAVLKNMKPDLRLALLYHRYMESKFDPDTGKKVTEPGIAHRIGCSTEQYRHRKKSAYKRAEMVVVMMMDYDHSKKIAKREVA